MPNERDNNGFPTEGVRSLGEAANERDREMIRLYESDPDATTDSVGEALGISGIRVSQRMNYWFALGVDMPKWKERRRDQPYRDPGDSRRVRR